MEEFNHHQPAAEPGRDASPSLPSCREVGDEDDDDEPWLSDESDEADAREMTIWSLRAFGVEPAV